MSVVEDNFRLEDLVVVDTVARRQKYILLLRTGFEITEFFFQQIEDFSVVAIDACKVVSVCTMCGLLFDTSLRGLIGLLFLCILCTGDRYLQIRVQVNSALTARRLTNKLVDVLLEPLFELNPTIIQRLIRQFNQYPFPVKITYILRYIELLKPVLVKLNVPKVLHFLAQISATQFTTLIIRLLFVTQSKRLVSVLKNHVLYLVFE